MLSADMRQLRTAFGEAAFNNLFVTRPGTFYRMLASVDTFNHTVITNAFNVSIGEARIVLPAMHVYLNSARNRLMFPGSPRKLTLQTPFPSLMIPNVPFPFQPRVAITDIVDNVRENDFTSLITASLVG